MIYIHDDSSKTPVVYPCSRISRCSLTLFGLSHAVRLPAQAISSMSSVPARRTVACQQQTRAGVSRSAGPRQVVLAREAPSRNLVASAAHNEDTAMSRILDIAKTSTLAFAAAVAIGSQAPALGAQTLRLPISGNKQIAQVQEVMLETWSVVGDSFFDGSALVRVVSACRPN